MGGRPRPSHRFRWPLTAIEGAITLLAYFHYCNKGIFPFSDECKDQELKNLAELDDEAVQFVHSTRKHAVEHSKWPSSQARPAPPPDGGAGAGENT